MMIPESRAETNTSRNGKRPSLDSSNVKLRPEVLLSSCFRFRSSSVLHSDEYVIDVSAVDGGAAIFEGRRFCGTHEEVDKEHT